MKNKHYFSPHDVNPYHPDYRNWHTPGGVPARLYNSASEALEAAAEEDPEGSFLYITHFNGWWVPGEDEQHPEVGEDRFFWGVADPRKSFPTFLNQFKVLTFDKSVSPSEALFELVQWNWVPEQLEGIQEISYLVDDTAVEWLKAGSPDFRVKIRYYYDPPDTPVDPEYEEYIRSALEDAFERLSGSDWRFVKTDDLVVELLEGYSMPRITFDSGGEPLPGEEVDLIEAIERAVEDAEERAWISFCDDNKDDLEE